MADENQETTPHQALADMETARLVGHLRSMGVSDPDIALQLMISASVIATRSMDPHEWASSLEAQANIIRTAFPENSTTTRQ